MRRSTMIVSLLLLLVVTLPATANPPAFRIGVECGPLWGVSDNPDEGVMPPNNPNFYNNQYFYSDLKDGGFDYDRIVAFQKRLWNTTPAEDPSVIVSILRNDSLYEYLYPGYVSAWDAALQTHVPFHTYWAWSAGNSDTLAWNDATIGDGEDPNELPNIWNTHFFVQDYGWNGSGLGNAMQHFDDGDNENADEVFNTPLRASNWQTVNNPAGLHFIIGRAGRSTLDDTVYIHVPGHSAMSLVNNGKDQYELRLLMKRLFPMTNAGDTICTMYYNAKGILDPVRGAYFDTTARVAKFNADFVQDSVWKWIPFYIDSLTIANSGGRKVAFAFNNSTGFALRWQGDATHGKLKVARISFEGNRHKKLFPTDHHSPDGGYWTALRDTVLHQWRDHGDILSGWMVCEPEIYGARTVWDLREHLPQQAIRGMVGAQWPTLVGDNQQQAATERFYDSTGVEDMWYDTFVISGFVNHPDPAYSAMHWWHWENSYNGSENFGGVTIEGKSIQYALDNLIDGGGGAPLPAWMHDMEGIRWAKQAADNKGKRLHIGVQSVGEIHRTANSSYLSGNVEPTPRMVKCMAFLALTFRTDGLFYSYYGSSYNYGGIDTCAVTVLPFYCDRLKGMNGAIGNGMVSFCPDFSDTTDTSFWIGNNFQTQAFTDARGAAGSGWLRPNSKYYAAKEVNSYIREIEPYYMNLHYIDSQNAAEDNSVGFVTVDSTYKLNGQVRVYDTSDSMYVQIADFDVARWGDLRNFMLVNRRCDADGGRWVRFRITGLMNGYRHIAKEVAGDTAIVDTYVDVPVVSLYLPPATGRLFYAHSLMQFPDTLNADTLIGDILITKPLVVGAAATLTVRPASTIIFADSGKITVLGKFKALGNTTGTVDSTILFTKLNANATGLVTLSGTSTDEISYCKFSNLDKGLKIVKSTGKKATISHSEFSQSKEEGLYVSGGEVTVTASTFNDNSGDGAYFYNCKATLDSLSVARNGKNGIYLYSVNSTSTLKHSLLELNGQAWNSTPEGNVMFYNCSPKGEKNEIVNGKQYGLYGANGSYPLFYGSSSADNTIGGNASHETYWNASYPYLNGGHNNFDVADDTIIYITNISFSTFYAQNNYWGGGAPNIGPSSYSYVGPGTFSYYPYDTDKSLALPGGSNGTGLKGGQAGFGGRISEADDEAQAVLTEAIDAETERPNVAMQNYRRIIERFGETPAAPIAVERLLWMVRNQFADDNQRNGELDRLSNFYRVLADTSHNPGLVWKARRAALWALAAQHRYEEAIRGFEAIVDRHDNLADSVFAVIDAGTLQLEAREWAARDSGAHVQSMFGSRQELAPVSFEAHRKHTDELLGLLGMADGARRSTVPTEYFLDQNYPNPFNAVTQIKYGLPEASDVKLRIYDLMGREVITLIQGQQKAGYYRMLWDGKNAEGMQVTSGMYFVRLETPNFTKVNKMTLVK